MDYAFYAIAWLISIVFVLLCNKINTTQRTLVLAHSHLDNSHLDNSQTAVASRLAVYVSPVARAHLIGTLSTLSYRTQALRTLYNKAALAYNDCQRNAIRNWLARHLGYEMAPPC